MTMKHILAHAAALPDDELLRRLQSLAGTERESTVVLVAHLAALVGRRSLYAARGFGSLFAYCREALRLSEDAAYYRIKAAKACRRFPIVLDLLASGELTLTTVRLLAPVLTTGEPRAGAGPRAPAQSPRGRAPRRGDRAAAGRSGHAPQAAGRSPGRHEGRVRASVILQRS